MQISWNYIDNFNMFHMKTPDLLIAAGIFNVCLKTVENFYMNYCFRCDIWSNLVWTVMQVFEVFHNEQYNWNNTFLYIEKLGDL